MVKIKRSGKFTEQLRELSIESLELSEKAEGQIILFLRNPNDTRLDNHPLTKRMSGKWAFSITDDIRITYEWLNKTIVRFMEIGRHEKVYVRQAPKR